MLRLWKVHRCILSSKLNAQVERQHYDRELRESRSRDGQVGHEDYGLVEVQGLLSHLKRLDATSNLVRSNCVGTSMPASRTS